MQKRLALVAQPLLETVDNVYPMPSPDDVKDVLAAIGLHEDGDEDCNNHLLDHETGLDPATVDEVLDFLVEV